MTTDKIRKDKNQNIQVFIRLRPLNQREKDIKSLGVIEVVNNREVVVRQSQQTSHTKKFTFDRAFGPNVNQFQVYQEVVSPLIEEVLNGYNCTVFAYGQTGTGKTHTMVGEHSASETTWQNDPLAGIIPRALSQLFDELRLTNTEYTVRVSYLELYNEELFDLLGSEDNSKLRIYEDVTRKGSNIVNGLEEITVYNKTEVYKIMAQGQERKRVASTLMNAQSSRSHTVFTIVVHMKENSPEGEELVKIGKLNLVDLAGSENISKAGSDNPAKKERARECVNINQSLLTLGRVITALVERHPHIPYRESKLTRILQESLGGRTKTSIIATISPGHKDLEETMSTLEYAHRAKNIQNKPEVNQKMTKKAILKEYAEEIDRLKRDLQAARDKNGVYLASETFTEMTLKDEEQRKEIQELLLKKRAMEEERDRMENVFQELNQQLETRNTELESTKHQLDSTKAELATTSHQLVRTATACEEQQHLVSAHTRTEAALSAQAQRILSAADAASRHALSLHDVLDKRRSVESTNLEVTRSFRDSSQHQRSAMNDNVRHFALAMSAALTNLQNAIDSYNTSNTETQEQNKSRLEQLVQTFLNTVTEMKSATSCSQSSLQGSAERHRSALHTSVSAHSEALHRSLAACVHNLCSAIASAQAVDVKGNVAAFVQQWYSGAAARVSSLQRAHSSHASRSSETGRARAARYHSLRDQRALHVSKRSQRLRDTVQEMEAESTRLQQRLSEQQSELQHEREATDQRLQAWAHEERRLLEERLARHIDMEKQALEERLAKKMSEIEEQKTLLEQRMESYKQLEQTQAELDREEMEMAERDLEQSESGRQQSDNDWKKYSKEFEEGANAISVDMEVFSSNVVEVVEHVTAELTRALAHTQQQVQEEVTKVVEANSESCSEFVRAADHTLDDVVLSTKQIMDTLIERIESTNNAAIQDIASIAASLSSLISLSQATQRLHGEQSAAAKSEVSDMSEQLSAAIVAHGELEENYLIREYRVYTPTGNTPVRVPYRYPRALAATSPHDKILARLRANRRISHEDCIVIESDPERQPTSDSEGSVSEGNDSAVFAAPSPPSPHRAHDRSANRSANRSHHPIVKCTSETDIYTMRKQQNQNQGKENSELRSVSHKKPSKLPAPSSLKKPLVERNVN